MSSISDRRRGLIGQEMPKLPWQTGYQLFVWNTDQWVEFGTPSQLSEQQVRSNIEDAVKKGDASTPIGYAPATRRIVGPTSIYQPMTIWVVRNGQWIKFGEQITWISSVRRQIEEAVNRGDAQFMAYEGPAHPGALVVYNGKSWSLLYR